MTDTNYRSFVGDNGDNDLTVTPELVPIPAGTDLSRFSDILKFSKCLRIVIENFRPLPGGKEDCIDAVRGEDYRVRNCTLAPRRTGITLKGSINVYAVDRVTFVPGTGPEIEIGQFDNYWTPGRLPTRNGKVIFCDTTTGAPVRVRIYDGTMPLLIGGNIEVTMVPKCVWLPYFLWRYVVVRLQGVKTK